MAAKKPATGLGKTWLSAFDSCRPEFRRILFVAHREEILTQALKTFRRIRPRASLGNYNGTDKVPDADVLFASIQTLGRQRHLKAFERDCFDYNIVDEVQHAAAATYRPDVRNKVKRAGDAAGAGGPLGGATAAPYSSLSATLAPCATTTAGDAHATDPLAPPCTHILQSFR
jgi:type I site-specific restriction endonuclease